MQRSLIVEDENIPYIIRKHHLAKNISLKFSEAKGLELVMPHWASHKEALGFLHGKMDWILKNHKSFQSIKEKYSDNLQAGAIWEVLGDRYELQYHHRTLKKIKVILGDGTLELHAREFTKEESQKALEKFFKKIASSYLKDRVVELCEETGQSVNRVVVKSQSTRWGSCSSYSNLNLNWRLIFTPPNVVDSVVYHELTHLTHMDHSHRFWDLFSQYDPDCKKHDAWLKRHGAGILRIFRLPS
jgi:predicted metal-dependent hydrolase